MTFFGRKTLTFGNDATVNNYVADELVSWLQKDIRRGTLNAAFPATVLFENGYGNVVFNRLYVIALEDAGCTGALPLTIHARYNDYMAALRHYAAEEKVPAKLTLAAKVRIALCLADLSRWTTATGR